MTTKEILYEAFWGSILFFPNNCGTWPNDYKVDNFSYNKETNEMNFNISFTPIRSIDKIEVHFERSQLWKNGNQ